MRTIFFGTPEIAVPIVDAVAREHQVAAVVCQPDKAQGRSKQLVPPPVKLWAQAQGIPVCQPVRLNDGAFEAWFREQCPEIGTVAAYGRLLKPALLDIPPKGWLNVHPSLLPRYRGPSPIQAALFAGDTETGVTIMRMTEEMDAGDIVLQERLPIDAMETAADLSGRLSTLGGDLLLKAMALVERGEAVSIPQNPEQVIHCRLLTKEDGRIDWSRPALTLHNHVRACVPWPVAFTLLNGQPLRVYSTRPTHEGTTAAPGTLIRMDKDCFAVATGDGVLEVLQVQPSGKRTMGAAEFLRGHKLQAGQQFESPPHAG